MKLSRQVLKAESKVIPLLFEISQAIFMRYFFLLVLLIANGALALLLFPLNASWFALQSHPHPAVFHAEKIKLISANEWDALPQMQTQALQTPAPADATTTLAALPANTEPAVAPKGVTAQASEPATPLLRKEADQNFSSCVEFKNFNNADGKKFEQRLHQLSPEQFLSMQRQEALLGYMVFIPPQLTLSGAKKKQGELERLKISDFYLIPENGPFKWGISLGIFKTEEAAKTHLATLSQQGVHTAKIAPRSVLPAKLSYRLRALNPAQIATIEKLKSEFKAQTAASCTE